MTRAALFVHVCIVRKAWPVREPFRAGAERSASARRDPRATLDSGTPRE